MPADTEKPSYLGLLNAIAVAEGRADKVLSAWRDATGNHSLSEVLDFVAIREREHSAAFCKRICELGFQVREKPSETHDAELHLAASDASDTEKFRRLLQIGRGSTAEDPFGELFSDTTIDPITGALLGRYIAEERDSGRRLRDAFECLDSEPASENVLDDIASRLERLTVTLEELKVLRN